MVLSSYKIVWVEFRAQKGIVTKKDSKILMDSAFGDSYGKNARKHFASEENARKYLKEKAEAFKKLSKVYPRFAEEARKDFANGRECFARISK